MNSGSGCGKPEAGATRLNIAAVICSLSKAFDFPTICLHFCCIHSYFVPCGTSSALWLLSNVGRDLFFFKFLFYSCINAERLGQFFKAQFIEMVILAKGRPFKTGLNWACQLKGDFFDSLYDLAINGKPMGSA